MSRYDGKKVVVTGGSSGFGLTIAELLLDQGAQVLVTGRTEATLAAAADTLGRGVLTAVSDAASLADVEALAARVDERFGRIDALFVNAYLRVLRTLPGCASAYLISTGPELGIRRSRHLVSREPLLDSTLCSGKIADGTVALAAWPSEYHPGAGQPLQWETIGGERAFGITVDNLRSVDIPNLFGAGRVLSGDRIAGASVRVMGTAMATGHAAGVAAALLDDANPESSTAVRVELRRQNALLSL